MDHVRRLGAMWLLCAWTLCAQSDNSSISGVVKDPSGAIVSGAKVILRNEDTAFERLTTTNDSGFYTATNLPPGYYTVDVEAAGFKKSSRTRNKLEAAQPLAVNIDLVVGQLTETISVEASVAQLNTESATVGKTVEQKQIQNLTLNGRNPIFLALLKPGVRGGALSGFSFGLTNGGMSINGGRSQDSVITYDGAVGIRTRANGTSIGGADLDTVQEVQVLTANYAAEYGRSAAGQIRMVTRSGGKEFHGGVYEYFRNSALDANSWSRNTSATTNFTAPFRFNQFGYNVSGPVTIPKLFNRNREKLFFLWAQEWVKYRREDTSFQRVPTANMRNGDFSELLNPSNIFYGGARVINDPSTGMPFANNVIPTSRLSANGLAILRTYPLPNGSYQGNNNFFQVRPNPQDQRKDTVSVDFNPTQNQVIMFRFSNYNYHSIDAFRSGFDYAVTDNSRPNESGSLRHTWTLSPTMINEVMFTASADHVKIAVEQTGQRYLRSRSGINYPYVFSDPKEIQDKIPTVAIPNLGTIDGGPYPSSSGGPIYNLSDNVTKVLNNHTLKFGILWERSGQNDFDQINVNGVPGGTNNQNGRFEFTDARPGGAPTSGAGMANAALGLFSTYAEIGSRSYTPYRGNMIEFFGQDSWRVNEKLKLELGFRATWQNGYYKSLWGNMAYFDPAKYDASKAAILDPTTGNIISGDRYNGVVIPGSSFPDEGKGRVPAIASGLYDRLLSGGSSYPSPNQFNVMPRIGLAYQISSKQVFRAGFGGFMSRPPVYDSVFLGGNPPFQPMASITNGNVDNPGGTAQTAFPQFFMSIDRVYRIPRSYNWNFTYQREIGFETTLEVAYIGTSGNYLSVERDLNQLPTGATFQAQNAGLNVNYLRPFKGFASIPMLEHSARSEYNGLQIEANRRFKNGFSFGVAYTLSKSLDSSSEPRNAFIDVYNQRLNWGQSAFDTRHVAMINFIYEIPLFRKSDNKLVRSVAGGWQIAGVTQAQTGIPFMIGNADDYLGTGSTNTKPWNLNSELSTPLQFADRNAAGNYTGINAFWFDPLRNASGAQTLASKPANGQWANQNRNSVALHQPGFQNWNLSAFKAFQLSERQVVTFRLEAFNWLNHPNWGGATGGTTTSGLEVNPTSSTFGMVTTKGSERNLQLSLRYNF